MQTLLLCFKYCLYTNDLNKQQRIILRIADGLINYNKPLGQCVDGYSQVCSIALLNEGSVVCRVLTRSTNLYGIGCLQLIHRSGNRFLKGSNI